MYQIVRPVAVGNLSFSQKVSRTARNYAIPTTSPNLSHLALNSRFPSSLSSPRHGPIRYLCEITIRVPKAPPARQNRLPRERTREGKKNKTKRNKETFIPAPFLPNSERHRRLSLFPSWPKSRPSSVQCRESRGKDGAGSPTSLRSGAKSASWR